jgi:hypothetical protein
MATSLNNNGAMVMNYTMVAFVFLGVFLWGSVLTVKTREDEKTMKECVVAIATSHPDWKAEDLHTACR